MASNFVQRNCQDCRRADNYDNMVKDATIVINGRTFVASESTKVLRIRNEFVTAVKVFK